MDKILPFTEAKECTPAQLVVVTGIYGAVLFQAAGLIGDGSELLLLVPAYADLVGSVVLPVLGAVPDGMMVLFSGLGPRDVAQDQLSVGVGALAGSTIMLLTIAWYAGAMGGRVSIVKGQPKYTSPKLDPPEDMDLMKTGFKVGPKIKKNSVIMMITCLLYFFVQIPAMMVPSDEELEKEAKKTGKSVFDLKAEAVNGPAALGLIGCVICFFAYLWLQTQKDEANEQVAQKQLADCRYESIKSGVVTLRGAMEAALLPKADASSKGVNESSLLDISEKDKSDMKAVLKPFFQYYDVDKSGTINRNEFGKVLTDLREYMDEESEARLFRAADVDDSGQIDFSEFVVLMIKYIRAGELQGSSSQTIKRIGTPQETGSEGESEDEEEEVPEDLRTLSPEEQQRALQVRAAWMMGVGTILVLIFSDPAVDVLNEIGKRTGIPSFYISFILAPLASNASELVATYKYGSKKTVSSMTISLATLLGAACMNNTFCLAIFYALIWGQSLVWTFTAEVAVIILVQLIVGVIALKSIQRMYEATVIVSLFPLSLVFVWVANNIFNIP
ncbi:unnamed protein product [Amoebophrya sp. A25]|nr:unnamed protein product [Amoebophrya sp. A25]|eukprot:GSA25T00015619001.1